MLIMGEWLSRRFLAIFLLFTTGSRGELPGCEITHLPNKLCVSRTNSAQAFVSPVWGKRIYDVFLEAGIVIVVLKESYICFSAHNPLRTLAHISAH